MVCVLRRDTDGLVDGYFIQKSSYCQNSANFDTDGGVRSRIIEGAKYDRPKNALLRSCPRYILALQHKNMSILPTLAEL